MSATATPPSCAPAWRGVRRLLAVRLDSLGDVLMTTPALAAIRHTLPDVHLGLLTSTAAAPLRPHLPGLDELIAFDAPWSPGACGADQAGRLLEAMSAELARLRYDAAIIFTACTQSALPAAMLCAQAGIGLRLAHCREDPHALLTHRVADAETVRTGMRHEVARQLALVAEVGMQAPSVQLRFRYDAATHLRLEHKLRRAGVQGGHDCFVVHVGAGAPSHRYPATAFGRAAALVARQSSALAVFTGSAAETDLVEAARAVMDVPSVSLAGALDVGELGALIDRARVLVTSHCAPAHIAAALGTPVVDLYALTHPQRTPWSAACRVLNRDVACRNCLQRECPEGHHACLRGVVPERVALAALELMQGTARGTVFPLAPARA